METPGFLLDQTVYVNIEEHIALYRVSIALIPGSEQQGIIEHNGITLHVEKVEYEHLGLIWRVAGQEIYLPPDRYYLFLDNVWTYSFPFDRADELARFYMAYVERGTRRVSVYIGKEECFFYQPTWIELTIEKIELLSEEEQEELRKYVTLWIWRPVHYYNKAFHVEVVHINDMDEAMRYILSLVSDIREKFSPQVVIRLLVTM